MFVRKATKTLTMSSTSDPDGQTSLQSDTIVRTSSKALKYGFTLATHWIFRTTLTREKIQVSFITHNELIMERLGLEMTNECVWSDLNPVPRESGWNILSFTALLRGWSCVYNSMWMTENSHSAVHVLQNSVYEYMSPHRYDMRCKIWEPGDYTIHQCAQCAKLRGKQAISKHHIVSSVKCDDFVAVNVSEKSDTQSVEWLLSFTWYKYLHIYKIKCTIDYSRQQLNFLQVLYNNTTIKNECFVQECNMQKHYADVKSQNAAEVWRSETQWARQCERVSSWQNSIVRFRSSGSWHQVPLVHQVQDAKTNSQNDTRAREFEDISWKWTSASLNGVFVQRAEETFKQNFP